jgi:hypothetical protein
MVTHSVTYVTTHVKSNAKLFLHVVYKLYEV